MRRAGELPERIGVSPCRPRGHGGGIFAGGAGEGGPRAQTLQGSPGCQVNDRVVSLQR